jgi:uncharacterized membrane protein YcaP (DUF421 family)
MEKIFDINWQGLMYLHISPLEIFVRGTLTYWSILLLLRVFRRGTGQFSVSDILLIILIGDAAQNAMAGTYQSISEGILLVATLIFWDLVIDWMSYKFPTFGLLTQHKPRLLIKDGEFQRHNMRKELINEEELISYLREKGEASVKSVKACYLEGSGNLSVLEQK